MAAIKMMGTTITWNGTAIDLVHELDGMELLNELLEITSFGSTNGFREYTSGPKDGGETSFSLRFDPENASHVALVTDANTNPSPARTIVIDLGGVGVEWSASAIITSLKAGGSFEDVCNCEVTMKVTGAVTVT